MPGGDGTGPPGGGGPRSGRQLGGRGQGQGRNRALWGGAGPGGECACPTCGARMPHRAGTPCSDASCPQCGTKMVRA